MRYELREESTGGANSLANASSHHISGPNTIAYKQHQNCSSTRTTRPLELISDDPDDDVANRENYSPVRKVRRMGGGFNNNSNNNEATTNISISNNNNDNAAAAAAAAATPEVYKFLTFRHLLAKFEREDLPATLNANSNNNNSATSIPNGNNSDANAAIVHQQLEHTFIQLSTLQSKIRNYLLASSGSSPSKTSSTATSATSSTSTTTTITNSPSSSSSHQQQQTTTSKWQYSHGQELLHHAGGMLYSSSSSTSEEEDVVTAFADVRVVMPTPVIIPDIDYAIPSTSGNNINKNDYTPISVCSSNSPNSPPSDHTSTPSYSNVNANNNNNNDPSTPLSQLRRGSNNNNIASASSSPATPICKRLESLYDDTHQHNGIAALCDQTPFAARLGAFGKIYPSVPPASSSSSEGQDHGEAPDEVVLFDGVALLQPDGEDLYTSPVSSSSSSMHRRMISSVETTPIKMSPSPDNNKQKRNIRRVTRVPAANRVATTTTTATASGNGNGDNNDNQGDDVMMGAAEYKKKRRLSFGSLADQYNAHVRGYTIGATTTTTTTTTTSATIFSNNNNSSSSNNFTLPQQQQQQSEGSSSWKKLRLETPEQTAPASAFIFGNDFNQLQQQEHNNNNDDDLTMPTTTEAARKRSRFESVQQQQQQHQHQQQQHFEGPYRSQLLALHEMGLLKDLEVCTTLLLRHNGDISRVVQALLES